MNSHRLYRIELFAQRSWLVVAVLMFAGLASLQAQQTTGSIVGTVKDQTGAVVSAATVKATNVDTGFSRSATDKRLWGVPDRLSSRGQVQVGADGRQL